MKYFPIIMCTTALVSVLSLSAFGQSGSSTNSGPGSSGAITVSPGGTTGTRSGTASGNYNNNTRSGSNTSAGAGTPDDIQSGGSATNWNTENTYWQKNYSSRPYYSKNKNYTIYEPAYRYGVDIYNQNPNKRYEDLDQSQLQADWMKRRGNSNLTWSQAQEATRDSYNRLYNSRNTTFPNQ